MDLRITEGADRKRAFPRLGRQGTAAVEFALAMPFFLILLVGLTEVGTATYESMQVHNAVEAGALYASQNPDDFTGIASAVVNATDTPDIVPDPVSFCGCPGPGGVAAGDCVALCPGGLSQGRYVRVRATLVHDPILILPGLPSPFVLSAASTVRVQ